MDFLFFFESPLILDTTDLEFVDYSFGRGFLIDKSTRPPEIDESSASLFFRVFHEAVYFPEHKSLVRCRNGSCIEFISNISSDKQLTEGH